MDDPSLQPIDENCRRAFESAWARGEPVAIESQLPPADSALYRGTLEELIQIEMEFAWRSSAGKDRGPRVEDYLERFPILRAPPATTVQRLLEQEYRMRHQYGDRPATAEYAQRFPEHAARIERITPAARAASSFSPGRAFGRYRLVEEHARGGFGAVWRAVDDKLGREIALKKLSSEMATAQEHRTRFIAEARVTARLEHPGIVPVYDMSEVGAEPFFYAMKLVHGETLATAIARVHQQAAGGTERAVALRRLLNAFLTVCQTMEYAHAHGVVHRDLKPDNIVLSDYGETLILDWGLAKDVTDDSKTTVSRERVDAQLDDQEPLQTRPGTVKGTPAYMSPEQAAGLVDDVDEQSDVYALGTILYELLTGRIPFSGDTSDAVLQRVLEGRPDRPRTLDSDIHPALEGICLRAIQRDRRLRYGSVAALTSDVQHYLADEPVSACREPLRIRVGRWMRRHRTAVVGIAATVAVSLVGLVIGTAMLAVSNERLEQANQRERDARGLAEENFNLARGAVDRYFSQVSSDSRLRAVGLEQLRHTLLTAAGEFYGEFAKRKSDDPEVQRARANAFMQLSRITDETESPKAALASSGEAEELLRELHATHPDDAAILDDLAGCLNNRGRYLNELRRYDEAEAAYTESATLYERLPQDHRIADSRAAVINNLAIIAENTGRFDQAERQYTEAIAIQQSLVDAMPDDPESRYKLANTHTNFSLLLGKTREFDRAIAACEFAIATTHELMSEYPNEPIYPSFLASVTHNLGYLYRQTNRLDDAERSYAEALQIRIELVEVHPGVARYMHELAATRMNLGVIHRYRERWDDALTEYRAALELRERLREMQPGVPTHEFEVAGLHLNIGSVHTLRRQWPEARASYEKTAAITDSLVERYPAEIGYALDAGQAQHGIGEATYYIDGAEAALPFFTRAVNDFVELRARVPDPGAFTRELYVALQFRASLMALLGRHREAAKDWKRAIPLPSDEMRPNIEVEYALASFAAGDVDEAVAELARLHADGAFADPNRCNRLRAHEGFESLRQRPELVALMRTIDGN